MSTPALTFEVLRETAAREIAQGASMVEAGLRTYYNAVRLGLAADPEFHVHMGEWTRSLDARAAEFRTDAPRKKQKRAPREAPTTTTTATPTPTPTPAPEPDAAIEDWLSK